MTVLFSFKKRYFLVMILTAFLYSLWIFSTSSVDGFNGLTSKNVKYARQKSSLDMRWTFGKGSAGASDKSLQDLGAVGADGELYFHPAKPATLKTPDPVGKVSTVPIFPFNGVLVPTGEESIQVLEMQNRMLFNDVGDGVFGLVYLNTNAQKVALVGTLARVKHRKLLEDGRSCLVIEGIGRFFLKEVVADKPYLKAKVQTFNDYTESENTLDELESKIFDEVRFNVKVLYNLNRKYFPLFIYYYYHY